MGPYGNEIFKPLLLQFLQLSAFQRLLVGVPKNRRGTFGQFRFAKILEISFIRFC